MIDGLQPCKLCSISECINISEASIHSGPLLISVESELNWRDRLFPLKTQATQRESFESSPGEGSRRTYGDGAIVEDSLQVATRSK